MFKTKTAITYKTESLRARRNLKNCARPYGVTTVFQERQTDKLAGFILGEKVSISDGHLEFSLPIPLHGIPGGSSSSLGVHCPYTWLSKRGVQVSLFRIASFLPGVLHPDPTALPSLLNVYRESMTIPRRCVLLQSTWYGRFCSSGLAILREVMTPALW